MSAMVEGLSHSLNKGVQAQSISLNKGVQAESEGSEMRKTFNSVSVQTTVELISCGTQTDFMKDKPPVSTSVGT